LPCRRERGRKALGIAPVVDFDFDPATLKRRFDTAGARGLSTRRQGGSRMSRTVPLVRVPRALPKILQPAEVDRPPGALRTGRDRARSSRAASLERRLRRLTSVVGKMARRDRLMARPILPAGRRPRDRC